MFIATGAGLPVCGGGYWDHGGPGPVCAGPLALPQQGHQGGGEEGRGPHTSGMSFGLLSYSPSVFNPIFRNRTVPILGPVWGISIQYLLHIPYPKFAVPCHYGKRLLSFWFAVYFQVHREILSRCVEQIKTLAPILICSMKIFIQIISQVGSCGSYIAQSTMVSVKPEFKSLITPIPVQLSKELWCRIDLIRIRIRAQRGNSLLNWIWSLGFKTKH